VPEASQLRALHTLHDAMLETLRLHSIGPAITRTAAEEFEFAGCRIPQGSNMLLVTSAAHFLSELYPNPDQFDLARYNEPRNEHKKKGAYAPFGLGTHICLGAGAAEIQIVLALATVLHLVRLERVNSQDTLPIRNNPTPTLGYDFKARIAERRHHIEVNPVPVLA
jgi:cytochrome P450